MSSPLLGAVLGLAFGVVSVLTMVPLPPKDKRRAMAGAFVNRFAIGFIIAVISLPLPHWAAGLVVGFLLSLPDAIIPKAWAPIMLLGAVGGTLLGIIVGVVPGWLGRAPVVQRPPTTRRGRGLSVSLDCLHCLRRGHSVQPCRLRDNGRVMPGPHGAELSRLRPRTGEVAGRRRLGGSAVLYTIKEGHDHSNTPGPSTPGP